MGFGSLGCFNKVSRRQIVTGQTQRLAGRSAKQIRRLTNIKIDGLYWVRPSKSSAPQQVYCDMNTDGGGWMMIARTHPTSTDLGGQNWGWRGGAMGSINDFSKPYQLGFYPNWFSVGASFTEFAFGNQYSPTSNAWGPYVYKQATPDAATIMNNDFALGVYSYNTIKYPANYASIYATTSPPWMQALFGWAISGTASNIYWMRDVSGFSNNSYGLNYYGMSSTYFNDPTYWTISGPWGAGANVLGDGTYNQVGSNEKLGGTSQVILMVRE